MIQTLQALAGLVWLGPLLLFSPCAARIWRGKGDALDWVGSPVAFVASLQFGFFLRWMWYPHVIVFMEKAELILWAGLYVLSALCAASFCLAWRIARRLRYG